MVGGGVMANVTKIRFLIDNVQGGVSHTNVAIAEVELRSSVGGVDETTNTGGTATASNWLDDYVPSNAVDDDNATMWNAPLTCGTTWWAFEPTSSIDLVEYTITSRASYLDDSPTEWRLQYWNGSAWILLDDESTTADWTGNEKRTFSVTTPSGWTGKINGVTNPAKINGMIVANISKVMGVS